mgnify:CR=1 FL=1
MRFVTAKRAAAILFHLCASQARSAGTYLVPANACPVVPLAILQAGGEVEFVDIDDSSLAMNQALLLRRLGDRGLPPVAGIVFIRPYGAINDAAVDFTALRRLSRGTLMIDDRCAARPETDPGQLSSGADIYLFSTGYGKYVDLRLGGYAFMEATVEYEPGSASRHRFQPPHYQRLEARWQQQLASGQKNPGTIMDNAGQWLDTGPLLLSHANYRDRIDEQREIAARTKTVADQIYRSYIPAGALLGEQYHNWRHQVVVDNKTALIEDIFAHGLFASGHYDTSARLFSSSDFPRSDHLYSRIVNLFNDFHISEPQILAVARLVQRHLLR